MRKSQADLNDYLAPTILRAKRMRIGEQVNTEDLIAFYSPTNSRARFGPTCENLRVILRKSSKVATFGALGNVYR